MGIITWSPSSNDYTSPGNWSPSYVLSFIDAAVFGASTFTNISIDDGTTHDIGEFIFTPRASQYSFTIGLTNASGLRFSGSGIVVSGGTVEITVDLGGLVFFNNSTAGTASITISVEGGMGFADMSTGGSAKITNSGTARFVDDSTAGSAKIETLAGAHTNFEDFSTGGNAQLVTDAGGTVDFSQSKGPNGDFKLTVGSIQGPGTSLLGGDQLTVGNNGPPTYVSGLIDDAGLGGSLVKVGHERLTLSHAFNTYSAGTGLDAGTLDIAAVEAAGTGPISFGGKATLAIENAALSPGHVFENHIKAFGKHDTLDLAGLHFHAGATAKYHPATDVLTVHSGHGTDKLTLVSPHGTHFQAASDHHGGTEVFLFFA
jgi:autotransporter-associated beta strand protein